MQAAAADFTSLYAAALREHAGGFHERAVERYRAALAVIPDHAEANANLGTALLALERADEAIACYRAALDADPFLDSAHGPLGMALSATGAHVEACAHLEIALQGDGENADLNFHLGESKFALGRFDEACLRLERALETTPDHYEAALKLAEALRGLGKPRQSIQVLEKALALRPGDLAARFHLAAALLDAQRDSEALELLEELARESDEPSIVNNLVIAQMRAGKPRAAVAAIRKLLDGQPDYANGWNTLGMLHFNLGELSQAIRAFEQAIHRAPDEPEGYVNLSGCLIQRGDRMGALRCVERAASICAPHPAKLLAIADQFATLDELKSAIPLYGRVLELDPQNCRAASRLLHLKLASCQWSEYDDLVAQTLGHVRDAIAGGRPLPYVIFNLLALPVTHEFVQTAARHQAATLKSEVATLEPAAAPFVHEPRRRDRIRIGYMLPYTYFHSMPLVLKEIVRDHDRRRFEIYGYSISHDGGTAFDRDFRSTFDRFRSVAGASTHAAARAVHADEIDVLVDTTGHTPITCLPVMSLRPAPVQVHAIGFGLSTGADYIDYLISDRSFIPPEERDCCREQLVYMPDCFLPAFAQPQETDQMGRAFWHLPEDGVVFANFNEPVKFEPRLFDLWMRILAAVPGSVLWLGSWHRATASSLKAEAEKRGVSRDRLVFAPIVQHYAHARRLPLADIALDNISHGGGITTIDALSAGVPVVTLRGATPQTRLGATLSQTAGVPDLIVDSLEEYERKAVELALNPAKRAELRARLVASRSQAPLFDINRYRRHLEQAYETMWSRHVAGEPPASFDVRPL